MGFQGSPLPNLFLLDAFPNASAAYSFRRLLSAYSGYAVRIRRSSDNAEQDIGFVGKDFDTASAASFIGGGSGFVTTWYDQSGNGNNAIQTTAGNQPTYSASGINGNPATTFAISTSTQLACSTASLIGTKASVFLIVAMNSATGANGRIFSYTGNGQTNDFDNTASAIFIMRNGSNQAVESFVNLVDKSIKAIPAYSTAFQGTSIFDGTNSTAYVNNSAGTVVAATPSFTATGKINIGANVPGDGSLDGPLSEIILYQSDQTASATNIYNDQKSYWGTP